MTKKHKKNKDTEPEQTIEQPQEAQAEELTPAEEAIEMLEEKIKQLEDENAQLTSKLQRVCADYDNLEKRIPKRIEESVNYQKESLFKAFIPGIDNFDHALNVKAGDVEDVLKGVKMVYDHILNILKGFGVEQIQSADKPFDPAFHQAMMQRCEDEKPDGIVLEELQKGYTINGRTLRPSMVIVNKIPAASTEEQEDAQQSTDE